MILFLLHLASLEEGRPRGGWRHLSPAERRVFFFIQAEDGIRASSVTGVQTCALPIWFSTKNDCALYMVSDQKALAGGARSEERRVGKECRCGWSPYHEKKKERFQ